MASMAGLRRKQPFDPLAEGYATVGDFDQAVNQQAKATYKPQLQTIAANARDQERRHEGRLNDITQYGGYQTDALGKAYQDTASALDNLMAQRNGQSADAQTALRGALSGSLPGAQQMGQALDGGSSLSTLGALGSVETAAAQREGLSGIQANEAARNEGNRYQGIQDELDQSRANIQAGIPAAREQAREQLLNEERTAATQRLQNRLAQQEFGLKKQTTKTQTSLAKQAARLDAKKETHAEAVDAQNFTVNEQQVANEKARIAAAAAQATSADQKTQLELKGKLYDNGVAYMNDFLKPAANEAHKKDNGDIVYPTYRRDPATLYRALTGVVHMSPQQAYQLMLAAPTPPGVNLGAMHAYAQQGLDTIKAMKQLGLKKNGPVTTVTEPGLGDTLPPAGGLIGQIVGSSQLPTLSSHISRLRKKK